MKRLILPTLILLSACAPTPTPASFFDTGPVTPTQALGQTPEAVPAATETPQQTEPVTRSEPETGELYFFLQPRAGNGSIELVKVSAACIADPLNCPAMEKISVPFAFNFTINALTWSKDGRYAAFSYSASPNGTPTQLWIFDANARTWAAIAEFPFIDPPFWSPDGAWIAFRVQDGAGGEDVYIVRPDGTGLQRISADLPVEGRPYIMDGWYTENVIMRSALPGANGNIYLVRAINGQARPMFETLLTKAQFIASPDAGFFAYDEYDYNSQNHFVKVMEPDGANAETIAQFTGGSIYPMIWSPDSSLIAFNYYGNMAGGNPVAEVFVIRRTGGELKSVYKGSTVGRLLFSPNGKYLLIEETTSATGGHLFLVDLATSNVSLLQAPGLSTDYDWYAPSWRP
ncbi:MAG: PD40 domain-containing protein [Chloroflexi bacterium]|nr:PD40 domain-containing protein [Chloroflexota bacterium]